jgi:hypothetical protein
MKKILLYLLFLTATCQLYAAAPSNDVCSGAITLTPSASCNPIVGTTEGATDNNETGDCTAGTENAVWFKFVATSSNTTVLVDGDASFDAVVGVLTACGSTTRPTGGSCTDNTANDGIEKLSLSGLTIGSTYYIQVHEYAGEIASTSDFAICIIEGPNCSGPGLSGPTYNFSGCPTSYSVSYNVTSLGSATSYSLTNANGYTVSPSTVTSVPTTVTISGIPIGSPSGNTTLVHNGNTFCNFIISSVTATTCPPANDECTGAIALTPSSSCSFSTYTTVGATSSAGAPAPGCASYTGSDVWFSVVIPASGNVTIDSQTGTITDSGMAAYSGTCGSLSLIECDDDDSANGNMSLIALTGRTPGETIYIRFWKYGGGTGTFSICATTTFSCTGPGLSGPTYDYSGCPTSYSVSYNVTALGSATSYSLTNANGYTVTPSTVTSVPTTVTISGIPIGSPTGNTTLVHNGDANCNYVISSVTATSCPASNDECASAIPLTVGTSCSYTTYSNTGATNSTNSAPTCASYAGGDVWFSAVVPASGDLVIDTQTGDILDSGMQLYSGTCGSLTAIECDDDDSGNGSMSKITRTDLTPGSTVYIRIWEYAGNSFGTFGLCVYEPAPAPNCSAGNPTPADLCADAPVLNNPNGFCGTTSSSYTIGDPGDADAICGSPDNNSYLQFVAADVSLSISWWVTGGTSCTSGVQFAIFSGSCASPTLVSGTCINPTGGTGSAGTWNITGLTVDATYYLYIDGYAGDVCNYVFAAESGVQLPIELTYFNGKVSNGTHYLNWATASERKNAYFEVERSFDGTQFTKIGKVISKANQGLSVQKLTYDYNDLEPADGINYYRLKQVDLDGKHSYSKVISLSSSKESNSIKNLYPNPTSSKLDLMVQVSQEDFYVIEVYDILGKRVDVQKIVLFDGINQHSYDASLLSKGYYRMMLKDDKGQILSKNSFIKN